MSFEGPETALEYYPCRYGKSRTRFRGPRVKLESPYTVVLGGSDTYGKYIEDTFCDQVAERTGRRVVNLGVMNGGIDVFVADPALMKVIQGAETVVIQMMGAQNLSNRFYTVHPRRNDRFLRHSVMMESLFPHQDFSDFAFTRHMLTTLRAISEDKFALVTQELQAAWTARMRLLISRIPGRKLLCWIENPLDTGLGAEPLFVTSDMMQTLEPLVDGFVHCDVADDMTESELDRMFFPEVEYASARQSLTPAAHDRIATILARAVGEKKVIAA